MKNQNRKLNLSIETIRCLSADQLGDIGGGQPTTIPTGVTALCANTQQQNCTALCPTQVASCVHC